MRYMLRIDTTTIVSNIHSHAHRSSCLACLFGIFTYTYTASSAKIVWKPS